MRLGEDCSSAFTIEYANLSIDFDVLNVAILNGRIVIFDEHLLKELKQQRLPTSGEVPMALT
jgi:hypothetical protein